MATLESDKVREVLSNKLNCVVDTSKRSHDWYFVYENGEYLSGTFLSKGSKETLGDPIVSQMAKQLKLGVAGNFVKFVRCTLDKPECLKIIRTTIANEYRTLASFSCPRCRKEISRSFPGKLQESEVRDRLRVQDSRCDAGCGWPVRLIDLNTAIKIVT